VFSDRRERFENLYGTLRQTRKEGFMRRRLAPMLLFAAVITYSPLQAQDAAAGERIARARCATCHTMQDGGPNRVGPNLWRTMQRAPGTAQGFRYQPTFVAAVRTGFRWNEDNLSAYLLDPSGFLRYVTGDPTIRSSKTIRVPREQERQDLIAYLRLLR
jgi:cytochrome c